MSTASSKKQSSGLRYFSSLARDTWGGNKSPGDYEWWYFDALSDDGSEVVLITFLDNYLNSPIYNQNCEDVSGEFPVPDTTSVPAVAFAYFKDGTPVYHAVAPYDTEEFEASTEDPYCRIGTSSFEHRSVAYGSGYAITIAVPLSRGRRLRATFEWLSIESDLMPHVASTPKTQFWNLVAPRSDVSGRITVIDKRGRRTKHKFRGTGYHDHNLYTKQSPLKIEDWFWGRAHFPLATAIYYRYRDIETDHTDCKLLLVRDGRIDSFDTRFKIEGDEKRTRFGIRYPNNLTISGDGVELRVRKSSVLDSTMSYLRLLSEMSLREDDRSDHSFGISEYLPAAPLKNSLINRLLVHWHRRGDRITS
ncbi:MAG: hypothetical protein OEQ28_04925 [Acidobacteriota bacterium]|nr:hypothetical protein [Acidobacteriota bacterium]